MKKISIFSVFAAVLAILLAVWFFVAVAGVQRDNAQEGKAQLEAAVRRAAVACYAAEGAYPPSLDYLKTHYGVQVNEERYVVYYTAFAENLMPEITALEKK